MNIEWSDELETGHAEIDGQHREIFRKVNALLEASQHGKGAEAVAEAMSFIEDYVLKHFKDEEKLQVDTAYPGYEGHKAEHDEFMRTFAKLKEQYEAQGATLSFIVVVNKTLSTWLLHHIKRVDVRLAEHVRKGR